MYYLFHVGGALIPTPEMEQHTAFHSCLYCVFPAQHTPAHTRTHVTTAMVLAYERGVNYFLTIRYRERLKLTDERRIEDLGSAAGLPSRIHPRRARALEEKTECFPGPLRSRHKDPSCILKEREKEGKERQHLQPLHHAVKDHSCDCVRLHPGYDNTRTPRTGIRTRSTHSTAPPPPLGRSASTPRSLSLLGVFLRVVYYPIVPFASLILTPPPTRSTRSSRSLVVWTAPSTRSTPSACAPTILYPLWPSLRAVSLSFISSRPPTSPFSHRFRGCRRRVRVQWLHGRRRRRPRRHPRAQGAAHGPPPPCQVRQREI